MKKVIGMLVALAIFSAMPAVAFGQGYDDGDVTAGPAQGGGSGGDGGSGYDGGDGGDGGDGCAISQAAGGDAHAENNCFNTNVSDADGDGVGGEGGGDDDDVTGVGGGEGEGGGVGGGGVGGVTLARTGFDAWMLAVIGGLSLAGGLGLLAAQRRGRIGA